MTERYLRCGLCPDLQVQMDEQMTLEKAIAIVSGHVRDQHQASDDTAYCEDCNRDFVTVPDASAVQQMFHHSRQEHGW